MRIKILYILSIILLLGFSTKAQLCVSVDCKDTIRLPQTTVSLNSVVSSTLKVTSILWGVKSAPVATIIVSPSSLVTSASGLTTKGLYVFSFTAIAGNSTVVAYDSVVVVPALNVPPIAIINPSAASIRTTDSLTLSGSGSSDPDGTIVSYLWSTGATTSSIKIKGLNSGTYSYSLKVTDNSGASVSTTSVVTVTIPTASVVAIFYIAGKVITIYSDGTVTIK